MRGSLRMEIGKYVGERITRMCYRLGHPRTILSELKTVGQFPDSYAFNRTGSRMNPKLAKNVAFELSIGGWCGSFSGW